MRYYVRIFSVFMILVILVSSVQLSYYCSAEGKNKESTYRSIITDYLVSHFAELNRFGFEASPMLPDNIKVGKFFNGTLSIYVWRFSYSEAEYQNRSFLYSVFGIYPPQYSVDLQEDLFQVNTEYNKNISEYKTTMRVITNEGSVYIECKWKLPSHWEWYSL